MVAGTTMVVVIQQLYGLGDTAVIVIQQLIIRSLGVLVLQQLDKLHSDCCSITTTVVFVLPLLFYKYSGSG